jgi:hypothetical protein
MAVLLLMAAGAFYYWRRGKKADEAAQQQKGVDMEAAGPQDSIPRLTENPMHNSGTATTITTDDPRRKSAFVDTTALYGEEDVEGAIEDMDIEMRMTSNPMTSNPVRDSKMKKTKSKSKKAAKPSPSEMSNAAAATDIEVSL